MKYSTFYKSHKFFFKSEYGMSSSTFLKMINDVPTRNESNNKLIFPSLHLFYVSLTSTGSQPPEGKQFAHCALR